MASKINKNPSPIFVIFGGFEKRSKFDEFLKGPKTVETKTDATTNPHVNATGPEVAIPHSRPVVSELIAEVDNIDKALYNSDEELSQSERIFLQRKKENLETQIKYLKLSNQAAEDEINAKARAEAVNNYQ